jgi:hypothetical protein
MLVEEGNDLCHQHRHVIFKPELVVGGSSGYWPTASVITACPLIGCSTGRAHPPVGPAITTAGPNDRYHQVSGGQQRRLDVALALIGDPAHYMDEAGLRAVASVWNECVRARPAVRVGRTTARSAKRRILFIRTSLRFLHAAELKLSFPDPKP